MRKTTPKAKNQNKKSVRWFSVLLIFAVLLGCMQLGGKVQHYHELQEEAAVYQAQLVEAEAEYQAKLEQVALLENDDYLKRMAREKLGMVMQGETVVSVVRVAEPSAPVAMASAPLAADAQ